jgi:amidase
VGLKPSRGRISQGPNAGESLDGIATDLVVSRSVRDTAAALDAARGDMPGDPYAEPPGPDSFLEALRRKPKKLRIAFALKRFDGRDLHPDSIAATKRAAKLCEELGHEVEEAVPQIPADALSSTFDTYWTANLAAGLDIIGQMTGQAPSSQLFDGVTWAIYRFGKQVTVTRYLAAKQAINGLSREMARFHETHDVWITPTLARPPEKNGVFEFDNADRQISFDPQYDYLPFTPLQNMTGQPAINLPLFWNKQGLPIGTQFVGRFGDEETLLRLAAQIEKAQPWFDRYATIALN